MAILLGGVAFETPAGASEPLPEADPDTVFPLVPDRDRGHEAAGPEALYFSMYFDGFTARVYRWGLRLSFNGVTIGEVKSITVEVQRADDTDSVSD